MKFIKIRPVKSPERGTALSAGIDFFVPEDFPNRLLHFGQQVVIPSGIKVKVPEGYALIAFNKSGVSTKLELQIGACVIDEDYQGEVHINVYNRGLEPVLITAGMKLAQFILLPVNYSLPIEVSNEQELYEGIITERADGAFGSTNK